MAGAGGGGTNSSNPSSAPKILLAKPGLVAGGIFKSDEDCAALRARLPSIGSLNLLSDSWEFHTDRFLPFLTDNTDFTVVGVIGPPSVGKSTIMNEIYGFDVSSPGMLPPFAVASEDIRGMAKHCTTGIEPRVSSERIILLDTQPVFSPSVLAEMIRPDGSSTVSVINGEALSAELAHEVMSIQLGVLLASICHIILVVSEGVHDASMWRLMSTVDLLKHHIPDPSSLTLSHPQNSEKEAKDKIVDVVEEYMATPAFVHTKLRDQDLTPHNFVQLKKALSEYFCMSSFLPKRHGALKENCTSTGEKAHNQVSHSVGFDLFLLPSKHKEESSRLQYESYFTTSCHLRDQVLSMSSSSFSRTISERDWLKNSAKIWELVKSSSILADYCKALQNAGVFRR